VLGDKAEEQANRVAIAFLGVGCHIAVNNQLIEQESTDEGSHQVLGKHGDPPVN
jgi:hypothetical protein